VTATPVSLSYGLCHSDISGATSVLPAPTRVFEDAFEAEALDPEFELPPQAATAPAAAAAVAAMVMRCIFMFMAIILTGADRDLVAGP
jgi:hypothetical protein